MALDQAAADAACTAWMKATKQTERGANGGTTGEPDPAAFALWSPMFRAIFAGIQSNAVVSPAGATPMNVGGNLVVGTGKVI